MPASLQREPSELQGTAAGGGTGGGSGGVAAVTGIDAATWGRGRHAPRWSTVAFDRILVDAPCSSERHIIQGAEDGVWSRSRLKRDAALQSAILRNGARLLSVGGRLVYSTCSLADEENDGVVSKLIGHKRHGAGLALVDALGGPLAEASIAPLMHGVERTECGALMLPDRSRFGPLYWAVIKRHSSAGCAAEDEEEMSLGHDL